jgi:Protein of unknown function (DUF3644)
MTRLQIPFQSAMRPTRHSLLLNKAIDAALAAIEVYNKPKFSYREEAFSILMVNAWELLLKARIPKENGNRMRSIEVWAPQKKKDGTSSTVRHVVKTNRCGNHATINLHSALSAARSFPTHSIDDAVCCNLELLVEVRDNAVHLQNKSPGLKKRVHELGSGALRNFANAASTWFGKDLSEHNFFIMPLAFETPEGVLKTAFNAREKGAVGRLVKLISEQQAAIPFDPARSFNVGVQIEMRFVRTISPDAIAVRLGPPTPGAIPITVTEEQALAAFPWEYRKLCGQLAKRYSDFLVNEKFHALKRKLEKDPRFCKVRLLDPEKPKGPKKGIL